jgi:nucleotide-binding universal stress UspA family protein
MANILVAYDGSEGAQVALDQAAMAAKSTGAALSVLSVVPVTSGGRAGPIDPTSDVEDHDRQLDAAIAKLKEQGVEAEGLTSVGHPADTICRIAQERNVDLIVVGSRGLHGVERFLMGSVSTRVAQHAECSVLIAR